MLIILSGGILLRLVMLGNIPGNANLNQDEIFAAYEAYSISNYGIDSHGYHNPVYLEAWGSGMNALETYLMIPFIRLFGMNSVTVRLPQALVGCVTLLFVYLLFNEISDKKTALWGTLLLSVSPWHIMLSRWALESNMLVGMLTIAVYFLVSSNRKIWRIAAAGIFMGLALYCYSAAWIALPVLILGILIYLFIERKITWKETLIYVAILFVSALPLLLFVAVNLGYIGEIKSFISVPALGHFRNGEISFSVDNIKNTIHILWTQNDGNIWSSTERFGIFYHFSKVFFVIGLFAIIAKKNKKAVPVVIWFFVALIQSFTVDANFTRINMIFIPMFFAAASGIEFVVSIIVEKYKKIAMGAIFAIYCLSLVLFLKYYATDYNRTMAEVWFDGFEKALNEAVKSDGTVHIKNGDAPYPLVLFYTKYPTDVFVKTVDYFDPDSAYLHPLSFEGYSMTDYTYEEIVEGEAYICYINNEPTVSYMHENDMEFKVFGNYIVGVKR